MSFENPKGEAWNGESPGGFAFGLQGFTYGPSVPKSITFFLDNSCIVADQYGRKIPGTITPDGTVVKFADSTPDAMQDGIVVARPQFATHQQVIASLNAERIDWLSYEVRYRARDGQARTQSNLTLDAAVKLQARLLKEGNTFVVATRTIACAGWPQLPYSELVKLPELPPTPEEELARIQDPQLRKDALRIRRERDIVREKEMASNEA